MKNTPKGASEFRVYSLFEPTTLLYTRQTTNRQRQHNQLLHVLAIITPPCLLNQLCTSVGSATLSQGALSHKYPCSKRVVTGTVCSAALFPMLSPFLPRLSYPATVPTPPFLLAAPSRAAELLTAAAAHRAFVEHCLWKWDQQQTGHQLAEVLEGWMTGEDAIEVACWHMQSTSTCNPAQGVGQGQHAGCDPCLVPCTGRSSGSRWNPAGPQLCCWLCSRTGAQRLCRLL